MQKLEGPVLSEKKTSKFPTILDEGHFSVFLFSKSKFSKVKMHAQNTVSLLSHIYIFKVEFQTQIFLTTGCESSQNF